MATHKFGSIVLGSSSDKLILPIHDDAGNTESLEFKRAELSGVIIEILACYDVDEVKMTSLIHPDLFSILENFPAQFKGIDLWFDDDEDIFTAAIKDGDTGVKVTGTGRSAAGAIADIARSWGFKSKLPEELTIHQWFIDMQYGFARISDELLQAEMDALYAPDKGAW